jgi:curved DNA-binding protein CbpA
MPDATYYTVLGLSETATQNDIDRAFRSFVEAYEVLSDSAQRSSYDQQLARHRQQQASDPTAPSKAVLPCPLYPEVFSKYIGCSVQEAKDLLAGRLAISPALARKLQSAFGSSVEFWMSQPFEAESMNPFPVMAGVLLVIGLGCALFVLVARVL